jgi:hypothetical protein
VLATHPLPRLPWRLGAAALAIFVLASCGGGGGSESSSAGSSADQSLASKGGGPLEIRTVNNRADLISGGDAMIEVSGPPGQVKSGSVKVTRNGVDVTSAFSVTDKDSIMGLVTGLADGDNTIEATFRNGPSATLVVTNAPRQGPVLSGALIKPFYCATPSPQSGDGVTTPNTAPSGLSHTADANCNIATEFKVYYRTSAATCTGGLPDPFRTPAATGSLGTQPAAPANPCWKEYTGTPTDVANVTTDTGLTVPFIVRRERGTMNRGIYDLAVLYDPSHPTWTAMQPQSTWNGKVYYSFGSSTGQPRRQIRPQAAWTSAEEQLKRGFMFVTNSMTDSARNSNRVMMTETVMMMKEHISDTYGKVKYTLGTGCSGGSINSNMNLSIAPGQLDGVITTCTYPDSETTSLEVGDCSLLVDAYQSQTMKDLWSTLTQGEINARKAAINGHLDQTACQAWFNLFGSNGKAGVYTARQVTNHVTGAISSGGPTNNCELPNTAVYDPANAPATSNLPRCNAWSWAESIWGKAPGSPAARDTRDNVGVQYGLKALRDHVISAEEFVTLNEVVGGIDRDSTPRAARTSADLEALNIAYRAAIVASGSNLAKAAIIDMRGWDDSLAAANTPLGEGGALGIHHMWFSWAVRDRITRDYGDAANQALWRFSHSNFSVPPGTMALDGFVAMDHWLTDVVTSTGSGTIEQKVRATRPASTRDFCLHPSNPAVPDYDTASCDADIALKPTLSPRQAAGGPRTEDILKCQLKPVNANDYGGVAFSNGQWTRLNAVFAAGVCDWSKPGVGQQAALSPLTFKAGPGGQPLPPAPVSTKK